MATRRLAASLARGGTGVAPLARGGTGIAPLARGGAGVAPLARGGTGLASLARGGTGVASPQSRGFSSSSSFKFNGAWKDLKPSKGMLGVMSVCACLSYGFYWLPTHFETKSKAYVDAYLAEKSVEFMSIQNEMTDTFRKFNDANRKFQMELFELRSELFELRSRIIALEHSLLEHTTDKFLLKHQVDTPAAKDSVK